LNFQSFNKTDILHINYGEISLRVEEVEQDYLKCVAINSGQIQIFNSLSVEGKEHFTNNLIINDKLKLQWEIEYAIKLEVEFIVMSILENSIKEIK
jgi:pyruvate kinase